MFIPEETMAASTITRHIVVPGSPEQIFELFCRLTAWWPLAYTFSLDRFEHAEIERRQGGQWFERDTGGRRISWGNIRAFEPPRKLVLEFGIAPDRRPAAEGTASEVEVRFAPAEGGTELTVEHRQLERHGEGAEAMRAGMDSAQGWSLILAELRRAARRPGTF
jgi:uncharacterized protein YndB with AHSA1/START domain